MRILFLFIAVVLFHTADLSAQQNYELNKNWLCKNAGQIKVTGEELSTPSFQLSGWGSATVPGTVLTTMLNNKQIPDPFYGMNNKKYPIFMTRAGSIIPIGLSMISMKICRLPMSRSGLISGE